MDERLIDEMKRPDSEGSKIVNGRHVVYKDSRGFETAGYGRLMSKGFSQAEADLMLEDDVQEAVHLAQSYSWFSGLDDVRQDVVTAMIFNLGKEHFDTFAQVKIALMGHDWDVAAQQMLQSQWAVQVGQRAQRYARIMRSGIWE